MADCDLDLYSVTLQPTYGFLLAIKHILVNISCMLFFHTFLHLDKFESDGIYYFY